MKKQTYKWLAVTGLLTIAVVFLAVVNKLLTVGLNYISAPSDIEVAVGVGATIMALLSAFIGFSIVSVLVAKLVSKFFTKHVK